MNEKLYEALEVCLNALETGADLEAALKRFPNMAEELRPVLETSIQAQSLALPAVPEAAIKRGRARVLQHANEMRKATVKPRQRWAMFAFPRLATSLVIALVFLFGGTGLVRASTGALPGDNLYPVKRTWEDVRLTLSFDPEIREELESEFDDERLHEIDELLGEGRHETIKFAGLVTEQNGDQWLVSGIPVQITPDSNLPGELVAVGDSIIVEGRTNDQGFVEAGRVEMLGSGLSLPAFVPTKIEGPEGNEHNGNSGSDVIESSQDDLKIDTSLDNDDNSSEDRGDESHNGESNRSKDSSDKDNGDDDSNSGSGSGNGNDDNSHDNDNDSHDDHSGSGGEGNENDNGDEH